MELWFRFSFLALTFIITVSKLIGFFYMNGWLTYSLTSLANDWTIELQTDQLNPLVEQLAGSPSGQLGGWLICWPSSWLNRYRWLNGFADQVEFWL